METEADRLLLDWVMKQFPEWSKHRIDLYNARAYRPGLSAGLPHEEIVHAHTLAHLRNCKGMRTMGYPNHEWECSCYSEYTRDDRWQIHVMVTCPHGLFAEFREELYPWDMPDVVRSMADEDEGCQYDDVDY